MSADRKRFFQKLKGSAPEACRSKPVASHVEKPKPVAPLGFRNDRLKFLAGLTSVTTLKAEQPERPDPPPIASFDVAVDFNLASLKEFGARCAIGSARSSQSLARKRPHYDNRMRCLNKKMNFHIAIFGFRIWYHSWFVYSWFHSCVLFAGGTGVAMRNSGLKYHP